MQGQARPRLNGPPDGSPLVELTSQGKMALVANPAGNLSAEPSGGDGVTPLLARETHGTVSKAQGQYSRQRYPERGGLRQSHCHRSFKNPPPKSLGQQRRHTQRLTPFAPHYWLSVPRRQHSKSSEQTRRIRTLLLLESLGSANGKEPAGSSAAMQSLIPRHPTSAHRTLQQPQRVQACAPWHARRPVTPFGLAAVPPWAASDDGLIRQFRFVTDIGPAGQSAPALCYAERCRIPDQPVFPPRTGQHWTQLHGITVPAPYTVLAMRTTSGSQSYRRPAPVCAAGRTARMRNNKEIELRSVSVPCFRFFLACGRGGIVTQGHCPPAKPSFAPNKIASRRSRRSAGYFC